jgi:RNA polymerase sigma-70 factor (ECF subfamily)
VKISDSLLARVRQWDEEALAEVYDQFAPALYRYVYRLTGHENISQDIVADTFHRFLIALRNGSGPEKQLSAWLYRVAHNLVVDHYRRQPKQEVLSLQDNDIDVPVADGSELRVEQQELATRTRVALQYLTPLQQQVIALRFLEGMSQAEVAQIVNRTVGAVKGLQHRALNALRSILEEHDASDI